MNLKEAKEIVGSLSKPSKMPCRAYNTQALNCKRGQFLATIPGTVCSKCYARKGRYLFKNVVKAMQKRELAFYHPDFVEAMVLMINKYSPHYFRWFDSGDLQSVEQLQKIVDICVKTPNTKYWLPTREYKIVKEFLGKGFNIPDNLIIRFSKDFIDDLSIPDERSWSTVISKNSAGFLKQNHNKVFVCPSKTQGNKCLDCRACWNSENKLIAYIEG